ncbi:MAG: hypothetical protein Q8S75_02335, partial [Nitrospirota bacterium]|nr:hypothetical protein [Nitrospirota bacterium]
MSEHDLEKLLGGFAADTLTPEEKQQLYGAALQDQQLFNALADEQAFKELLADPAVRRRLLAALKQPNASRAGRSFSWLDWVRRPTGLAFAGGLTAAALAVVLGIRIYQDSLKQAAQSVVTEESRPAAPPTSTAPASQPAQPQAVEPQVNAKENSETAIAPAKKDTLAAEPAKQERAAPPSQQKHKAADSTRDNLSQRNEQDEVRRQADTPVAALSDNADGRSSSADQTVAASVAPPPAPAISARALFYGEVAIRQDTGRVAPTRERAMSPLAESTAQANRLERKLDQSAPAGKAATSGSQLKPLGLRYSFMVQGAGGQDREVSAAMASKSPGPLRLTLEANQAAYLQVWLKAGPSTPQLLIPQNTSGQISLKIAA